MNPLQDQLDALNPPAPRHGISAPVHTRPVNEQAHLREIIRSMKRERNRSTDPSPKLHIGVAGFANFDLAVAAQSDAMLLCDINRDQIRFWKTVVALLATHETPQAFTQAFTDRITMPDKFALLAPDEGSIVLRTDCFSPSRKPPQTPRDFLRSVAWLTPEAYAYLHSMARAGTIAAAPIDLLDIDHCRAMHDTINQLRVNGQAVRVDTVYGSNVYDISHDHPGLSLLGVFKAFENAVNPMHIGDAADRSAMPYFRDVRDGDPIFLNWVDRTAESLWDEDDITPTLTHHMRPVVATLLKLYLQPEFQMKYARVMEDLNDAKKARLQRPLSKKISKECFEVVDTMYRALSSNPDIDSYFLNEKLRAVEEDLVLFMQEMPPRDDVSYAAIRSLANRDDSHIYCSSIRARPLITFEGQDSPRAYGSHVRRALATRTERELEQRRMEKAVEPLLKIFDAAQAKEAGKGR